MNNVHKYSTFCKTKETSIQLCAKVETERDLNL